MKRKNVFKRLLFPRPAVVIVLALVSVAGLAYSFIRLQPTDAVSIISYVVSFYSLTLICVRIPELIEMLQCFRQENRYYLRYSTDIRLKMNIHLYGGLVFNAAYAVFQLVLGLWHASVWFYAMALYYLLLAGMRFLLVQHTRSYAAGEQITAEWKKYRLCGALLLVMNLALTVMLIYFVWSIRVFRHHEITTIAMAAYTFSSLTLAILNVIRYRQYGSPVYSAAKAISLAAAVVSMLTLENAMLTVFGEQNSEAFHQIMLGASGVAVILAVQGVAIYMIVNACKKLRVNNSQT